MATYKVLINWEMTGSVTIVAGTTEEAETKVQKRLEADDDSGVYWIPVDAEVVGPAINVLDGVTKKVSD